jgi:hypothetical protein
MSSGGIVVSEDGTKQDNNAVQIGVDQLVNAFIPYSLFHMFSYNIDYRNVIEPEDELRFIPTATALVPMIVTNAHLYRLKPEVADLDAIRNATEPSEIAEEVEWTWYYFDLPFRIIEQNRKVIDAHLENEPELVYRFPGVADRMVDFAFRPNWIAVVNIKALQNVANLLQQKFLILNTHDVRRLLRPHRYISRKK